MKRMTRWIAVAAAIVAVGGAAYGVSQLEPTEQSSAPAASGTSSSSTKPDDNRPGGTPDQHTDKPGENKQVE